MIIAKELMIGNWILLGNSYTLVYQILYSRKNGYSINHKDYKEDFFEPIPITPDILLKCGFVAHIINDREGYYEKGWFVLNGINNTGLYFGKMTKVLFLHRLQNLYRSLTNTNLIIEL